MKKLLVTGFDPFDERGYNTSSEIFSYLPEEIAGYQLIKKIGTRRMETWTRQTS